MHPTSPPENASSESAARRHKMRVIINANAGNKGGLTTNTLSVERVRDIVQTHGLGDDIVVTTSEQEAIDATRAAVASGCDIVVAAGGDGTAGVVAGELLNTDTALGIFPMGTVMNMGRMLGIPRDPEQATAILACGHTRHIDVGKANDRLFFECGSVGLNAAVFRELQRIDDGDKLSSLRAVLTLLRYRPARMVLHLDNRVMTTRALMVSVANGPYTGVGFTVAPFARLDDGRFDVRIFRRFRRLGLLVYFATIAFGRRRPTTKVRTYHSATVRIESRHPLPCRADAHDLGTTPVTFSILPGALKVVVPPES